MAVAGNWLASTVTPSEYAGAARWGTGVNPVHAIRDEGPGRGPTKIPLGKMAGSDIVPDNLTDVRLYGFEDEDTQYYVGEDYRYLENDHPNWGETSSLRPDRDARIMAPDGTEPVPTGFPEWGPHFDDNPVDGFPVGGPPGGSQLRSVAEGADIEHLRAVAVPSGAVTGGWLNKTHGEVLESTTSDPSQYEMTTSMTQLHKVRANTAAVIRVTDDPRSDIGTRLTGQKVKSYAMSSGMGGGPGTPDMAPVAQDLPFRPWYFRSAALPPPPDTTYGTMTAFEPMERVPPVDAGELVTTSEVGQEVSIADVADQDYFS
jgi:hypothetical protein